MAETKPSPHTVTLRGVPRVIDLGSVRDTPGHAERLLDFWVLGILLGRLLPPPRPSAPQRPGHGPLRLHLLSLRTQRPTNRDAPVRARPHRGDVANGQLLLAVQAPGGPVPHRAPGRRRTRRPAPGHPGPGDGPAAPALGRPRRPGPRPGHQRARAAADRVRQTSVAPLSPTGSVTATPTWSGCFAPATSTAFTKSSCVPASRPRPTASGWANRSKTSLMRLGLRTTTTS